ncbi:hypothetical protein ACQEVB_03365 [Pseudonocardia sp. CA-107938]|uniref:hypothetical protein n=1 Tax=Pseudonocardia sp. CA-107938 TaxID=3240021 RepID=UPI003D900923
MNDDTVTEFFSAYRKALLDRDTRAVTGMYAVPALIVFPGNSIAVTDAQQTADFFASAWKQYDGVDDAEPTIAVMAEAPGSTWVDVTWTHGGRAQERFCYQLVEEGADLRIAVLTPMALPGT